MKRIHKKTAEFPVLRKWTWLDRPVLLRAASPTNPSKHHQGCVRFSQRVMWNTSRFLPTQSPNPGNCYFMERGSEGKAFVYLQSEKKAKAVQAVTTGLDLFLGGPYKYKQNTSKRISS